VINLQTRQSIRITDDDKAHDAVWIPNTNDILFLKSGEKGSTQIVVVKADQPGKPSTTAELNAPVRNLKLKRLDDASVIFIVTGQVGDDGLLYNAEAHERRSTGRIFDGARLRTVSSGKGTSFTSST
jgi:hypothetical protein